MKVCIYIIRCSKTDRVYVGRTRKYRDWTARCRQHFHAGSTSACNTFFEPEWNLLERFDYIDYPHMVSREQYYMDLYSQYTVNKIRAG